MSFADAVRTCLTKYATFSGRARRSEYWWFWLFTILVQVVTVVVAQVAHVAFLPALTVLALIIPGLAVVVRRLHDTGRSGWWLLIVLLPLVGGIWFLVLLVSDSTAASEKYGPSPKALVPSY
jgi:uncharacterized membrane protein YhaH (DUF805 family)